jgi:hypothetical protein
LRPQRARDNRCRGQRGCARSRQMEHAHGWSRGPGSQSRCQLPSTPACLLPHRASQETTGRGWSTLRTVRAEVVVAPHCSDQRWGWWRPTFISGVEPRLAPTDDQGSPQAVVPEIANWRRPTTLIICSTQAGGKPGLQLSAPTLLAFPQQAPQLRCHGRELQAPRVRLARRELLNCGNDFAG